MLVIALQDDVDNLYAIWNTVTDRFLGVNLGKNEAVGIIMDYKGNYTYEEALNRVEHPQPFIDIAKCIVNGCSNEKDIEKSLKCKNDEIRELKYIIDEKLGGWTKEKRYGLSFDDLLTVLKKADEYDKCFCEKEKNVKTTDKDIDESVAVLFDIPKASSIFASAIVCTKYDERFIPTKIINGLNALELYNLLRR